MDLAQLASKPELTASIGGVDYHFSEFLAGSLADLQSWIRMNVPHPIDAIKDHLDGLPSDERLALLRDARIEAKDWPPQVGTPEGAKALLGRQDGQIETLHRGLLMHQPNITFDESKAIYRSLMKSKSESLVSRIFGVLFGMSTEDQDGKSPKAEGAPESP